MGWKPHLSLPVTGSGEKVDYQSVVGRGKYFCDRIVICDTMVQGTHLCVLSHVWLFAILWTVAHQALLSTGFSMKEFWSRLLCPPPGDLPDPGIKPEFLVSPELQADFLQLEPLGNVLGIWLYAFVNIHRSVYKKEWISLCANSIKFW